MANIKIPRKQFEKEIGKLDERMQHKIAMFGTPLESFNDEEIELEIFPNRPDLLSYQGFKRSFLCFLGKKKGLQQYKINKPEKDYYVKIESSVKNVRPFTACAIVKNLKFDDAKIKEIIDLQEKLHSTVGRKRKKAAIGIYPLEKIKLPITFRALEPDKIKFVPLESEREMSGLQILQRHATGRDYAHLLAGKTKFPVFIDADKKVLSMPPIINSNETGKITEKTKDVFLEVSGFDLEIQKKVLNILVTTLADMGGKVYAMELKGLKEKTPNLSAEKKKISLDKTNKLLGLNLNEKQLKQYLEKMGHDYKKGAVEIAPWRTDILHEVDLIEDAAIAHGYDNFAPEIPELATTGSESKHEMLKRKLAEILANIGLLEVSNYHLTNKKDQFAKMGIQEKQEKDFIELEQSKTDYTILRKNLSHYLMKNLAENTDAEYPQKIFEIGRVFSEASGNLRQTIMKGKTSKTRSDNSLLHSGEAGGGWRRASQTSSEIIEKENLAIAIAPGNFTELKQIIEYLFRMLGIQIEIKEPNKSPAHFIDGRCAEIWIEEKEKTSKTKIGYFGEIHPRIIKNWKIKMPIALCEIEVERVFEELEK